MYPRFVGDGFVEPSVMRVGIRRVMGGRLPENLLFMTS